VEDDHDIFEPDPDNPTSDDIARALRWIGLIGGLALLGIAAAVVFD
jgi:hypothetical protein